MELGLEWRYYLYSLAKGLHLPDGGDGLVESLRPILGNLDHS